MRLILLPKQRIQIRYMVHERIMLGLCIKRRITAHMATDMYSCCKCPWASHLKYVLELDIVGVFLLIYMWFYIWQIPFRTVILLEETVSNTCQAVTLAYSSQPGRKQLFHESNLCPVMPLIAQGPKGCLVCQVERELRDSENKIKRTA